MKLIGLRAKVESVMISMLFKGTTFAVVGLALQVISPMPWALPGK